MPKINQEEYEILKSLDDKWKWIARNGDRRLEKYSEKPYKYYAGAVWRNEYNRMGETHEYFPTHLFQFIQWTDEEPYEIAELIEEYESEETEVNKQELIKNIKSLARETSQQWPHEEMVELPDVLREINQLDEPEVLSQEWIDENEEQEEMYGTYGVPSRKLQNLLVPKQEEVDHAYRKGFKEGERQTAEYFESITEEPSKEQVWKYLSEHGIEVVEKEPETVGSVLDDFYKSIERMKKVLSMEIEELEE